MTEVIIDSKIAKKREVIKIKEKTIKEWIPLEKIYKDGTIKLKNNNYIKIIKIMPINYNLKSELEKKSIINSYKIFLKTCNFPIQILIQSKKENLDDHILKIQKNIEKNKKIEDIGKEYIKYIKSINLSKKSSTKEFYIVINNEKNNTKNNIEIEEIIKNELNEKYFKIKECLSRCGNSVQEISEKEETIKILFSFLNTRKNLIN